MTTAKELAQKLEGTYYESVGDATAGYRGLAAANDLLIVYGASDDLIEFDGTWRDEADAENGTVITFDRKGLIPTAEIFLDDLNSSVYPIRRAEVNDETLIKEMAAYCDRVKSSHWVKVIMPEGADQPTFRYETDLPYELFCVYDDEALYCYGMVIQLPKTEADA